MDLPPGAAQASQMSPLLSVSNVRKQFATVTAVDDVSLTVNRGEIFALLGPNGAGKTTLLRMMLGLLQPDSGTIAATGSAHRDNGRLDPRQVGYLPEDRGLYPDVPVLRTLVYFGALRGMDRRAAATAAEEWLARMSLADRAREPLKSLSKGNQQKIQFISSVLHRPAFAVLDEPFSGLDPVNQDLFLSLIRELRDGGMTVVLSAHQMQLVERIADRLMVLSRGRVILSGTLDEIRRRWTTGSRLVVRYSGAIPADLMKRGGTHASVAQVDDASLTVFVPEGEPLGPVLAELGARVDVRSIESHAVTLHDVYVSAVAQQNDAQEIS